MNINCHCHKSQTSPYIDAAGYSKLYSILLSKDDSRIGTKPYNLHMYRQVHIVHSRGLGLYTEIYYAICRYLASSAKYLSKEISKMKIRNCFISLMLQKYILLNFLQKKSSDLSIGRINPKQKSQFFAMANFYTSSLAMTNNWILIKLKPQWLKKVREIGKIFLFKK